MRGPPRSRVAVVPLPRQRSTRVVHSHCRARRRVGTGEAKTPLSHIQSAAYRLVWRRETDPLSLATGHLWWSPLVLCAVVRRSGRCWGTDEKSHTTLMRAPASRRRPETTKGPSKPAVSFVKHLKAFSDSRREPRRVPVRQHTRLHKLVANCGPAHDRSPRHQSRKQLRTNTPRH